MLKRLLAVALLCLPLTAAVHAQSKDTKEVELSLSRIVVLANAIAALDGPDRIIKDGANERVQKDLTAYKFGPGFKIAMSRNLTALKPFMEGYDKEVSAVRASIAAACRCEIKDGSPELVKLNDENRRLVSIVYKVGLFTFQESEFKLDQNQIPVTVLSGLEPVTEFAR